MTKLDRPSPLPRRLAPNVDWLQGMEFVASVRGEVEGRHDVPVSVHDGCLFGDVLRSAACEGRARFRTAMTGIGRQECGIVIRLEPDASVFGDHAPPDRSRMALAVQVIRDLAPASVVLVDTDAAVADALIEQGCPVARP
jgi:3,4-dihydroxy 2-butanone 4-phosphate synthase/GTP cyclohydrolase II